MKRSLTSRRQLAPLFLLALAYLVAAGPLLWATDPTAIARLAPRLDRPLARAPIDQETPAAAFAALQARAAAPLEVHYSPQTGAAEFVTARAPADRLPYTPTAVEVGRPEAIARGFLDQNRGLFGLRSAREELSLLRMEPDLQLGYSHVRLSQVYRGLPVFGRQLVVHLDPQGRVVAVNGQFAPGVELPIEPAVTPAQALEAALANLRAEQLLPFELARAEITPLPEETRLMVYVDQAGKASLVWSVTILTASPLSQWRFFVNALRPTVVHAIDEVMPIKRRKTYSAQNTTRIPGRLLADEGERPRGDIARAAHDGAGIVYDYYFNTFQRNSIDGQGMTLVSTVNFGNDPADAENAAWVSEYAQMIYGDGGRIFRPLPFGLDVVGHEFTHGVIDASAQLIYEGQSGALNESYADIFGALIDRDDWTIGEAVVKSPPFPLPYLRSLEDPNAEGTYDPRDPLTGIGQPASMDEYANLPNSRRADNGGVHINSGIPNRAAFLVAQALDRERMEQIYYRALTQYLTPDSDFLDHANATIRAAGDLYGTAEVNAVRAAFAEVGITTQGEPTGPVLPGTDVPSAPPSAPAPDEALPAGCSDVIISGGFESDEGWVEVVRGDTPLIDTQLPRSGRRSAWLGGTDQEQLQYLYQDVRLPGNATSVELRYARLIHFETTGLLGFLAAEALFSTVIANTNDEILGAVEELPSSEGDDTWRDVAFDISQFAGKEIRLVFASENPRGNVSSFFVDDVQLIVCTTGQGPAAPPTSNQDLVYVQGQITDASTGRGVSGAQLFVLQPGLTASRAAADDNLSADEVLTFGTTDREGVYQTEEAVPRGQAYSVIVVARGYRPIIADGELQIPRNATNPFQVDAQLRRSR